MLWVSTLSPLNQQQLAIEHGFIPARIAQLNNPNMKLDVPVVRQVVLPNGQVKLQTVKTVRIEPAAGPVTASLISSMFIHGGWMHLVGNMWFLWIFGNNIEDRLGHVVYLIFYLVGGMLATGCHWAYDPASQVPVVGASGAVATVLGAYAVTYPKATISTLVFFGFITIIEVPALVWLMIWLGGQLFDAFLQQDLGVAVWAHIGGFAAGAILMPMSVHRLAAAGQLLAGGTQETLLLWRRQRPALRLGECTSERHRTNESTSPRTRTIAPWAAEHSAALTRRSTSRGHLLALESLAQPLDVRALFGRKAPLEIEVGSGKGLFLSAAAAGDPAANFLGIEIMGKYARFIAARLVQRELANARIVHGDAQHLFRSWLAADSVRAVHVYFPDPWWKARHKKRRVMNESFVQRGRARARARRPAALLDRRGGILPNGPGSDCRLHHARWSPPCQRKAGRPRSRLPHPLRAPHALARRAGPPGGVRESNALGQRQTS